MAAIKPQDYHPMSLKKFLEVLPVEQVKQCALALCNDFRPFADTAFLACLEELERRLTNDQFVEVCAEIDEKQHETQNEPKA